ncbi:MAG: hypothetical protein JST39_23040 [Bacteroidetes bacterium]|nr:hypothetical protein [Bacteroidota bacterium]
MPIPNFLNRLSRRPGTEQDCPPNPDPVADKSLFVLARIMFVGLLVIVIVSFYTWQEEKVKNGFWPVLGLSAAIGLVSLAVGGLLGFLFGIPLSQQGGPPPPPPPPPQANGSNGAAAGSSVIARAYSNNTNLEQISDWLTKIIVGVGLTQIPKLQQQFHSLVLEISSGMVKYMGNMKEFAMAYSGSLLLFYVITGFLFVYLWAKIYLKAQLLLTDRDIDKIVNSVQANVAATVQREVNSQVKTKVTRADIERLQQKIDLFNRQRARITQEEEEEEWKPIVQAAKPAPISYLDDAQKGRWGGQSTANGYSLTASFEKRGDSFYYVTLSVQPVDSSHQLTGSVYFFMHDSFAPYIIRKAEAVNNVASIRVASYEAFTVGVYCADSQTKLELDLNELPDVPPDYHYSGGLQTIDELKQLLEQLKQQSGA